MIVWSEKGSRHKWAVLLAGSLAFVAIGASDIPNGTTSRLVSPWPSSGSCGLLSGVADSARIRSQATREASDGGSVVASPHYEFDRRGEFRVWGGRVMIGNKTATFDYD